jgi:hypothetical protein
MQDALNRLEFKISHENFSKDRPTLTVPCQDLSGGNEEICESGRIRIFKTIPVLIST